MEQNQNEQKGVWVRLHLMPQTQVDIPPFIEGYLSKETSSTYVLTKVVKEVPDEDAFEFRTAVVDEHHHINRTYVWNCQVLGDEPPIYTQLYNGEGGLG